MNDYKIIRYDPMLSEDPYQTEAYATMEEEKWGEYVKQEDYEILEKKIAELEKERDEHMAHAYYILETCMVFSPAHFEAHNLEQQAKGVRDFFTNHRPRISMGKSAIWEVDDVLVDECIEQLTTKFEALKEDK
jgi:hypothetical protein